jgi:hypothetical protein
MNTSLLARLWEPSGRLQMAEGRLSAHSPDGTPVDDLFVVHHYSQPDPGGLGKVRFVGPDGAASVLGESELRELPTRDVVAVIECAGNGRGLRRTRAPGNQFGLGMFGQSRWTGPSLADVLEAAGLREAAYESIVVTGADEGTTMPEDSHDRFAKALPRDKALDPDTIVAWQLDGEDVPAEHGGPLRLVVPGWYGIWWVKWPVEVRLSTESAEAFDGFWQNQRYTYQDDEGRVLSAVRDQLPRAVLTWPYDGAVVSGDASVEILAWAGEHAVTTVELSADDGATWVPAHHVGTGAGPWRWTRWNARLPSGLPRGLRRIAVRAADAAGRTQEWEPDPNRLGYGNNQIHVVQLDLVAAAP